jgi:uncharacterized protein
MLPLDYYRAAEALQKDIFGSRINVTNGIQTNLTLLTEAHLDFLASGFFANIGVSFDPYGTSRVDVRGRSTQDKVLRNMQKLCDRGVAFAAITVLDSKSASRMGSVFRFFDHMNLDFRVLPFYRHASPEQFDTHTLDRADLIRAFCDIFDVWLQSNNAVSVYPLSGYIGYAIAYLTGRRGATFDRGQDELTLMVNTDGSIWGQDGAYFAEHCYGNMIRQPLQELLQSPARANTLDNARKNADRHCGSCRFQGYCSGAFVQLATLDEQAMIEAHGCPLVGILDHIVKALADHVTAEPRLGEVIASAR